MRAIRRPVASLLCACLALSAVGCYTSYEYAAESRYYVAEGMSMQEVADQLGAADQVIRGDPGTETVWVYRYSGGPGTVATIFLVIFFVVLVVALVAAASRGGSGGFGGGWFGGSSDPPWQIRIRFSPQGRVVEISPPLPAEGP